MPDLPRNRGTRVVAADPMASQPGLVVSSSAPPASCALYLRGTVASPVCLSMAVFCGCIGLGYAGVLGAVVAIAVVLALGAHAARYPRVRAYIDNQVRCAARARRERQRLKLLRPIGPTRVEQYNELRGLVDEIERLDPAEAVRFDLQDLLDHFVKLAVDYRRCSDALQLAGGGALTATPITDSTRSRRRRDIQARRLRHRDSCTRWMEKLADELAATDELIRLIAQRVASPVIDDDLDRELDRRLWELDEVDAALHQLSA